MFPPPTASRMAGPGVFAIAGGVALNNAVDAGDGGVCLLNDAVGCLGMHVWEPLHAR